MSTLITLNRRRMRFDLFLVDQAVVLDIAVRHGLNAGDDGEVRVLAEQVGEALLRLQILLDGNLAAVTSPYSASKTGKMPVC
jgi:hypothetical protein